MIVQFLLLVTAQLHQEFLVLLVEVLAFDFLVQDFQLFIPGVLGGFEFGDQVVDISFVLVLYVREIFDAFLSSALNNTIFDRLHCNHHLHEIRVVILHMPQVRIDFLTSPNLRLHIILFFDAFVDLQAES